MSFQIPNTVLVVSDVTASRAIDSTVYTNNTGRTLFVRVVVLFHVDAIGNHAICGAVIAGVNVGTFGIAVAPASMNLYDNLTIEVPPGSQYYFFPTLSALCTATLDKWIESY